MQRARIIVRPTLLAQSRFYLTHPASNYLIPEGEARPNYGSLVIGGLFLDTLLYCAIVFVVLLTRCGEGCVDTRRPVNSDARRLVE